MPEQPPGCTAIRSWRSSLPSCSSRVFTLPAAVSVRTTLLGLVSVSVVSCTVIGAAPCPCGRAWFTRLAGTQGGLREETPTGDGSPRAAPAVPPFLLNTARQDPLPIVASDSRVGHDAQVTSVRHPGPDRTRPPGPDRTKFAQTRRSGVRV
ncbi:exported hypothetical protein [Frankia sp. Hr75.2]|nr:exported hypothetical protein [Frankia sp. Hr75.2]